MASEDEIMENIEEATDAVTAGDDQTTPVDQVDAPNAVTEAEIQDHHEVPTTFAANADGGHKGEEQEIEGSSAVDGGVVGKKRKSTTVLELVGGNSSAGGSSAKKSRLNVEASGQEGVVARCAVCGKEFPSMKALFGHMRTHPDRPWRGVFPPPTFNPEGSPEQPQQQEQRGVGVTIDLNVPLPFRPPSPSPSPPPPSPKKDDGGASGGLDLNFPPPPEEE